MGRDSVATRTVRDSLLHAFGMTENEIKNTLQGFGSDKIAWKQYFADVGKELEEMQKQQAGSSKVPQ